MIMIHPETGVISSLTPTIRETHRDRPLGWTTSLRIAVVKLVRILNHLDIVLPAIFLFI